MKIIIICSKTRQYREDVVDVSKYAVNIKYLNQIYIFNDADKRTDATNSYGKQISVFWYLNKWNQQMF